MEQATNVNICRGAVRHRRGQREKRGGRQGGEKRHVRVHTCTYRILSVWGTSISFCKYSFWKEWITKSVTSCWPPSPITGSVTATAHRWNRWDQKAHAAKWWWLVSADNINNKRSKHHHNTMNVSTDACKPLPISVTTSRTLRYFFPGFVTTRKWWYVCVPLSPWNDGGVLLPLTAFADPLSYTVGRPCFLTCSTQGNCNLEHLLMVSSHQNKHPWMFMQACTAKPGDPQWVWSLPCYIHLFLTFHTLVQYDHISPMDWRAGQ